MDQNNKFQFVNSEEIKEESKVNNNIEKEDNIIKKENNNIEISKKRHFRCELRII